METDNLLDFPLSSFRLGTSKSWGIAVNAVSGSRQIVLETTALLDSYRNIVLVSNHIPGRFEAREIIGIDPFHKTVTFRKPLRYSYIRIREHS